jgi:hypothetical protein
MGDRGEERGNDIGPDLTTLDIFIGGFVKDNVYCPSLSANVDDLRARIAGAVAEITPNKLYRTWE